MNDLYIIENSMNLKEVFGSFKILDETDPFDHPAIFKFAKIVKNYINMKEILNQTKS